jgi:hypothetical protein
VRVASRKITAAELTRAVRGHWAIENSLRWVLAVVFRKDLPRSRTGNGPANMAVVRYFAFNFVRALNDNRSLKIRRERPDETTNASRKSSMPHPSAVGFRAL